MTDAPYVYAGYAVTAFALAGYVGVLVRRARAAARALPPEERRWNR